MTTHEPLPDAPETVAAPATFSRRWVVALFSVVGVVALLVTTVRFNRTASVPLGLYFRVPTQTAIERDDYVFACIRPGFEAYLGLERGYLGRGGWDCEVEMAPLIKRVVGVAGDTITVNAEGVFRNGVFIALPPKELDSQERFLWQTYGTWVLEPGHVWLGSDAPYGYDSRYLGPFAPDLIVREARPLLLLPTT